MKGLLTLILVLTASACQIKNEDFKLWEKHTDSAAAARRHFQSYALKVLQEKRKKEGYDTLRVKSWMDSCDYYFDIECIQNRLAGDTYKQIYGRYPED